VVKRTRTGSNSDGKLERGHFVQAECIAVRSADGDRRNAQIRVLQCHWGRKKGEVRHVENRSCIPGEIFGRKGHQCTGYFAFTLGQQ